MEEKQAADEHTVAKPEKPEELQDDQLDTVAGGRKAGEGQKDRY